MLSHIFYNDDDKLSREEVNIIKAFLSRNKVSISAEELKDIEKVIKLKPDINAMMRYKNMYKFNDEKMLEFIKDIESISEYDSRYKETISKLKQRVSIGEW